MSCLLICNKNNTFLLLLIQESPMIQRGTLDIFRRRIVCVRDAWPGQMGRKVTASEAPQCICQPSYYAVLACVSGVAIPTRRATCPSPWAVLVCHCWKETEKDSRASQVCKKSHLKIQFPAPLERINWTDPFLFFFSLFKFFLFLSFLLSLTERKNKARTWQCRLESAAVRASKRKTFSAKIQTFINPKYLGKANQHHDVK